MTAGKGPFLLCMAVSGAFAQAPLLQDGATALRQARLDWLQGQPPQEPSSMPSLEVGWGGAGADSVYAPLLDGEGLGPGSRASATGGLRAWGLGLQGRYVRGPWSFSATWLGLRDHAATLGTLHRAAFAFQGESGWRIALEQAPFEWGVSLLGGELMGAQARAFPRLSLATPEASLLDLRWRLEAFAGRLETTPAIPGWAADRQVRQEARDAGLDRGRPWLQGARLRVRAGDGIDLGLGAVSLDDSARPFSAGSRQTQSLVEARFRLAQLAQAFKARGASLQLSRGAAPEDRAMTLGSALSPARNLANLQLAWEDWDVGVEYAGPARPAHLEPSPGPFALAGFSTHGDPLGDAHWRQAVTRTLALGMPFPLEGRSRLRLVRATRPEGLPIGRAAWFLQAEAQWRTSTGRLGATFASVRQDPPAQAPSGQALRWGWSCAVFQAFRVF